VNFSLAEAIATDEQTLRYVRTLMRARELMLASELAEARSYLCELRAARTMPPYLRRGGTDGAQHEKHLLEMVASYRGQARDTRKGLRSLREWALDVEAQLRVLRREKREAARFRRALSAARRAAL
jgi:hypothetical protein